MAKKTHIKIKRGLLTKRHYQKMGSKIWLYLFILDNTDWDSGTMEYYRDQDAADQLGVPKRTIRSWRQGLETDGYIACRLSQHAQKVYIHNWSNPREKWEKSKTPEKKPDYPPDYPFTPLPEEDYADYSPEHSRLSVYFANLTHMNELTGGTEKWLEAIDHLVEAGVTEADIKAAVEHNLAENLGLSGPWSIKKTAISQMVKRKAKVEHDIYAEGGYK